MATIDLDGVDVWYDVGGEGEPLVLMHPGGTDSRTFHSSIDAFAARFRVFTFDRRSHGRTPDVEGPLSYEDMARETIAFLETVVGGPARVLGYSDRGVVGLYVARERPDLVDRLAHVAAVYHRDGWKQALEQQEEGFEFLAHAYAEVSPDGADHYPVVAAKLARMHAEQPKLSLEDLARIDVRILVMVGDDDEVAHEHALDMYRGLPQAELAIVPGTSHGLLVEKPALCGAILLDFFANDPVPTFAPIRRAGRR